jgi:hypothetical protein
MAERPGCSKLTDAAKDMQALNRSAENTELWDFVRSWLRRYEKANTDDAPERFAFLWASVLAWAIKCAPDPGRDQEDDYLVQCLAKDQKLAERFLNVHKIDREFHAQVDRFISLAPVFQTLWLQSREIPEWESSTDRREFIEQVFAKDPYKRAGSASLEIGIPAFAPACGREHLLANEAIPTDWPHVLSMIHQVRLNLLLGGKNYKNAGDRQFIELAQAILWEVWRFELPAGLLISRVSWLRAMVRSGFMAREIDNKISLADETAANKKFLQKILEFGHFGILKKDLLLPHEPYIEENHWLRAVDSCHGSAEAGNADDLAIMDTYLAGLVRWLNEIGITTTLSCDGHLKDDPRFWTADAESAHLAVWILNYRGQRQFAHASRMVKFLAASPFPGLPRSAEKLKRLLDSAEWLFKNREDLKSLLASMRRIIAPKTPAKAETAPAKEQNQKKP